MKIKVAVLWWAICTLRPRRPSIWDTYFYMTNLKGFRSAFPTTWMFTAFLQRCDHETKRKVSNLKTWHKWHPNLLSPSGRTGYNTSTLDCVWCTDKKPLFFTEVWLGVYRNCIKVLNLQNQHFCKGWKNCFFSQKYYLLIIPTHFTTINFFQCTDNKNTISTQT